MAKKNILAMVESQAATGREVKGLVCKVVPDNEKYEVTEYDPEGGRLVLTQMLSEDSDEQPDTLIITKENELVAHYDYNPNEKPAPDAEIIELSGKKYLVLDDEKQISMGNIKGIKVLGGKSGQVIFTVTGESDGSVDIMGYDVQFDTFYTIDTCFDPSIYMVNIDETHCYLVENIIGTKPVYDKDGKEKLDENGEVITEPEFISAQIHVIYSYRDNESTVFRISQNDIYDEDEDFDEDYETQFSAPVSSVRLVKQAGRVDIVVVTKSLDGNLRMQLYIDNNGYLGNQVGSYTINDENAKVFLGGSNEKPPVVTIKDTGVILIRTKRGLLVVDDLNVVKEMSGFDYFCGLYTSKDDEDRELVTWAYANADRSIVKKFTSCDTDRGMLFNMI